MTDDERDEAMRLIVSLLDEIAPDLHRHLYGGYDGADLSQDERLRRLREIVRGGT